jgi:glycosidase
MRARRPPARAAWAGALVAAACGGADGVASLVPVRDCRVTLRHRGSGAVGQVAVAGEWNAWSTGAQRLEDGDGDGVFEGTFELPAGEHAYKLVVDGDWRLDPENPYTKWVDGTENSNVRVADCGRPALTLAWRRFEADGSVDVVAQYHDAAAREGLDAASVRATSGGEALDAGAVQVDALRGRVRVTRAGLAPGKHTLRVSARDRAGREAEELLVPGWVEAEPFDWDGALMYFAFTDRFRNGDATNDVPIAGVLPAANYAGGDLAGVKAAIDEGYFDALGVSALWLSPVNANPATRAFPGADGRQYTGYHGYWPVEARDVEPRFGDLDTLKALVQTAHSHGIRVILDLVLNHVHEEHSYYRDFRQSRWFNGDGTCVCGQAGCGWEEHRLDCWFASYLPDVDWTNHDVVTRFVDDALFWVREVDVDGFRADAVKHFPHVAGRTLAARLAESAEHAGLGPRFYLVGETFTGEGDRGLIKEYVGPAELDGQFDFPVFWTALRVMARDEGSFVDLERAVRDNEVYYAPGTVLSPFIGNHDVPRFFSHAARDIADLYGNGSKEQAWSAPPGSRADRTPYARQALALAWLMTQRGAPVVYYGDEIGLPGAGDPDNRRVMRFGGALSANEAWLLARARALGRARADVRALRRGERLPMIAEPETYAYARHAGRAGEAAIVVLQRHGDRAGVVLYVPSALGLAEGAVLTDRLSGETFRVSGGVVTVPMSGLSARVLVP